MSVSAWMSEREMGGQPQALRRQGNAAVVFRACSVCVSTITRLSRELRQPDHCCKDGHTNGREGCKQGPREE